MSFFNIIVLCRLACSVFNDIVPKPVECDHFDTVKIHYVVILMLSFS